MAPPNETVPEETVADKVSDYRAVGFLYVALQCDRLTELPSRHELSIIESVELGRDDVRVVERGGKRLTLKVADARMSGSHAQLTRALGKWRLRDAGSRNGTFVRGVRTAETALADGDLIRCGHTLFLYREQLRGKTPAGLDLEAKFSADVPESMRTFSPALTDQFVALTAIARSVVTVMVHGESGTGKELAAHAVHSLSLRAGPFVAVNCGALPQTLIETELFGYRKGAFSGANEDRPGLVRSAHNGTLFLDEVGDLPLTSQATLLRVLQEKEVLPVGATRPVPVDLRVVTATHRDLATLVTEGKFRADLFARLSGYTLTLPPLRSRREDLGLLIPALLRRVAPDRVAKLSLAFSAAEALYNYDWPLNVRELEKCLSAAAALAQNGTIELEHLPAVIVSAHNDKEDGVESADDDAPLEPEDVARKEELVRLLAEHSGNVSAVARATGKARMQIQRWMKRYHLRGN